MSNDRNPVLARLDMFVGQWRFDVLADGVVIAQASMVAEWHEGGYLIQRATAEPPLPQTPQIWLDNSPMPTVSIIGLDDASETFTVLYSDARDVFRVYQMTLIGDRWTMLRHAPGFNQRLTATISDDASIITGAWERSANGTDWTVDFPFQYTKLTG